MAAATALKMIPAYPESRVKAELDAFLAEAAADEAILSRLPAAANMDPGASTIFNLTPHIDSLLAVTALARLEPIVGISLPDSLIRVGGYDSPQDFTNDLTTNLRSFWSRSIRRRAS